MKKIIDYTKTYIIFYKFICNDPLIINSYVGHTLNFTKRKTEHKSNCLNEHSKKYNYLLYTTIRNNGGWNNWTMFEIERKIVASKQDALKHEQYLIDLQVKKLNMQHSVKPEDYQIIYNMLYREQNKEYFNNYNKLYNKTYYQQNKERLCLKYKEKYHQKKELQLMSQEDK